MAQSEKVTLYGKCPCKVKLSDGTIQEVITEIGCPGYYTSDWQTDGGYMHDEGWADYDIADAEVVYPDKFTIIKDNEVLEPGEGLEIEKLIEVISDDDLVVDL